MWNHSWFMNCFEASLLFLATKCPHTIIQTLADTLSATCLTSPYRMSLEPPSTPSPSLTLSIGDTSIWANNTVKSCVQVVILSQVLACDTTLGYEDYCNVQLLKFNGTPVNNLRHLTELVEDCTETYMRFDLAYQVTLLSRAALLPALPPPLPHPLPFILEMC